VLNIYLHKQPQQAKILAQNPIESKKIIYLISKLTNIYREKPLPPRHGYIAV
jgi:hypothetical protein